MFGVIKLILLGALSYERGMMNDNGELTGDLWVWGRNRCICEHEHAKALNFCGALLSQSKRCLTYTVDLESKFKV